MKVRLINTKTGKTVWNLDNNEKYHDEPKKSSIMNEVPMVRLVRKHDDGSVTEVGRNYSYDLDLSNGVVIDNRIGIVNKPIMDNAPNVLVRRGSFNNLSKKDFDWNNFIERSEDKNGNTYFMYDEQLPKREYGCGDNIFNITYPTDCICLYEIYNDYEDRLFVKFIGPYYYEHLICDSDGLIVSYIINYLQFNSIDEIHAHAFEIENRREPFSDPNSLRVIENMNNLKRQRIIATVSNDDGTSLIEDAISDDITESLNNSLDENVDELSKIGLDRNRFIININEDDGTPYLNYDEPFPDRNFYVGSNARDIEYPDNCSIYINRDSDDSSHIYINIFGPHYREKYTCDEYGTIISSYIEQLNFNSVDEIIASVNSINQDRLESFEETKYLLATMFKEPIVQNDNSDINDSNNDSDLVEVSEDNDTAVEEPEVPNMVIAIKLEKVKVVPRTLSKATLSRKRRTR